MWKMLIDVNWSNFCQKKNFWVCFEDLEYELNISNNFRLLDQGVSYLKGFGLHFFEKPICKFDFDLAKLFIFPNTEKNRAKLQLPIDFGSISWQYLYVLKSGNKQKSLSKRKE